MSDKKIRFCVLSVSGTHCRSCEILIEKEISRLPGIKSVSASSAKGEVKISYQKKFKPDITLLNKIFKDSGYVFTFPLSSKGDQGGFRPAHPDFSLVVLIVLGILGLFYLLQKIGLFSSFSVSSASLSPSFFLFGLLAGFSTCAALVGGIVLSLSRQWNNLYSPSDSTLRKLQPVLMFNFGRLLFFSLFGAALGYFGSFFHLSLTAGAIVTIVVSVLMLVLGLQMLGVKALSSFQLTLPKSLTGRLADETRFQGRLMPLLMGGLTFFLPCGFTLTAQSLALASGKPLTGLLIMFFFALGTFIPLLLIGFSSAKTSANPVTAKYFSQVAGILVILFALFTANSQLTVLGFNLFPSSNSTSARTVAATGSADDLPPIVDGQQVLLMTASAAGYAPNHLRVKAGVPISWQITSSGNAGCAGAVAAPDLFPDLFRLTPGRTVTKELSALTPGTYRFTCSMGMFTGSIEAVN